MNYSIYRISLDIHDTASQVTLSVKRGDTGRKIVAVFTENGKPYKIADGVTAVFRAKKPADTNGDRAIVYNDADIIDNAAHYTLVSDNTQIAGVADCEFTLYGQKGEELTSPRFTLIIDETVNTDDEVESVGSNELSALASLYKELSEMLDRAEKMVASLPHITDVDLLSKNWVGSEDEFTQVVDIAGVTENSWLVINISSEQQAIFKEKNITFTIENEDGVVTVTCTGQKPLADYTVQVMRMEVATNG